MPAPKLKAAKKSKSKEVAAIEHLGGQLEKTVRKAVQAINARDFSTTSSAWSSFSASFYNDPDGPAFQKYLSTGDRLAARVRKPRNLKEFLHVHQKVSQESPSYRLEIVELGTTVVNEKAGYAQVIMATEMTGIPEGVVRRSMSSFEFRLVEGRWWCKNSKNLPGMDPSSGPAIF